MTIFHAAIMAALLAVGATDALVDTEGGRFGGQDFITREWTWPGETGTTTFTAYGPAGQVNALDPQVNPLGCEDCQLASSIQFVLEDGATLTDVADELSEGR